MHASHIHQLSVVHICCPFPQFVHQTVVARIILTCLCFVIVFRLPHGFTDRQACNQKSRRRPCLQETERDYIPSCSYCDSEACCRCPYYNSFHSSRVCWTIEAASCKTSVARQPAKGLLIVVVVGVVVAVCLFVCLFVFIIINQSGEQWCLVVVDAWE